MRESGIPFGFIFTLTQHNLHELEWVAQFAVNQGARLLQIHPLEIVGRAREVLPRFGPDEVERAYSVLETARIRSIIGDRLRVQLDLVDTRRLRDEPDRVFAGNASMDVTACRLGEVVAPLVIEADGTVVPIQHGFARAYALGNLHDAPLGELAVSWKRDRYHRFRELCRQVFKEITVPSDLPFANWYEVLGHHAERSAQAWR